MVAAEDAKAQGPPGGLAGSVGRALRARSEEVAERVVARWRASLGDGEADPDVEAGIRRVAALGVRAIADLLAQGDVSPAFDPGRPRESLAAKGVVTLSIVTKLHLAWREGCLEAIGEEAARLGAPRAELDACLAVLESVFEVSVERMARRFEATRAELEAELAARRSRLEDQALHDPLTGLANRALLIDRLDHAIRGMDRRKGAPAVLFVDLDDFKSVNDSVGHAAGDRALLAVADRLRAAVRPGDTLARLGGDEFVVLCEGLGDPAGEARTVAGAVLDALQAPFSLEGRDVRVGASIGVAAAAPGDHAEALLEHADLAMYHAKRRGTGRVAVYDPGIDRQATRRAELSAALGGAAAAGQMSLAYQPVVALATRRPIAREALLRWHHPRFGTVPPAEFVPLAVDTGRIVALGEWALARACEDCARWRAAAPDVAAPDVAVLVNVSGRQLMAPGFAGGVAAALARGHLAPGALTLEVPEGDLLGARSEALAVLAHVRATGVRIAVDDFGAGDASLSWLARLPIDAVKVGRGVVSALGHGDRASVVVEAMAHAARTLGLDLVAQGVETDAQLERLTALGFDAAQGYLLGDPVVPDQGASPPPDPPGEAPGSEALVPGALRRG